MIDYILILPTVEETIDANFKNLSKKELHNALKRCAVLCNLYYKVASETIGEKRFMELVTQEVERSEASRKKAKAAMSN